MGLAILLEEAFLHCELDFQPTETRVTGMGYTDPLSPSLEVMEVGSLRLLHFGLRFMCSTYQGHSTGMVIDLRCIVYSER